MHPKIHPLQEKSVKLLSSLYFEKHLPVTRAMREIIAGYYPALEHVLETLDHYIGEPTVQMFVEENAESIRLAKDDLKARQEAQAETVETRTFDDVFSAPQTVDAYAVMKLKSISEIEGLVSKALSDACGEELIFEIQSFVRSGGLFGTDVEVKATVKTKNLFR